ncbi:MAG: rod shape-determining protein MreC [Wenzhouxiangellaceae bacterium]
MFYSLLAIVLMALDFRGGHTERLRNWAMHAAEPLFLAVDWPAMAATSIAQMVSDRRALLDRIETLEHQLGEARLKLALTDDLSAENRQLRGLLDAASRAAAPALSAEVGAVAFDPFAHRLLLRRGTRDGVRVGMPALDADGVLGQVDWVGHSRSRIILITDPDHALPVQVLPGGERTIAYGTGLPHRLRLSDLPMNTAVAPGDLIVTSGLGGRFPAGLPVARVTALEREPGQLFAQGEAQPLAAMGRNRFVLLLDYHPSPDQGTPDAPSNTGPSDADASPEPAGDPPPGVDR